MGSPTKRNRVTDIQIYQSSCTINPAQYDGRHDKMIGMHSLYMIYSNIWALYNHRMEEILQDKL